MTIQQDQQMCSEQVSDHGRWVNYYPCKRKGIVEEDGKWWCKQHSPSDKKAKREARSAKYEKESAVRRAGWDKELAMRVACEGVATEDLRPGMVSELLAACQLGLDFVNAWAKDHELDNWPGPRMKVAKVMQNALGKKESG